MTEQNVSEHLRQLFASAREALRPLLPRRLRGDLAVVPVVRLSGVIGLSTPLRPGITLAGVARALERAFTMRRAQAVALLINSPGGSPVQSHLIYRRIRALAAEKKVPVIAFAEDVAASGGYMIACAADEIICDTYSIVGSIGVVGGSFGFHRAHGKDRYRAAALYVGRTQGDARSVPAGENRGCGAAQGGAARHSRGIHCAGEGATGSPIGRPRKRLVLRRVLDRGQGGRAGGGGQHRRRSLDLARAVRRRRRHPAGGSGAGLVRPHSAGSWQRERRDSCASPDLAAEVISALEARAMWARYGL